MANLIAKYNVTDTTSRTRLYNPVGSVSSNFTNMYVDGIEAELYYYFKFDTEGEHTVEFILNDNTFIGEGIFFNCPSLTSVTIPEGVKTIDEDAFQNCTSLTSVTLPEGLESIGASAFYSCTGLTSITIPDSVTSIGEYAFFSCTGLTSITIPDSVTSIGGRVFKDCTSLTSVTLPEGLESIGTGAFDTCTSLTSIIIPDSVTSIGLDTFDNCTGLKSLTIGSGVTSVGNFSFDNCTSLIEIISYATVAPVIYGYTFDNIATGGTLYYPKGSDYSQWLSTDKYNLGYYDWNGVEFDIDNPPTPDEPETPKPSYVILSKNEVVLDKVGSEDTIQVTYANIGDIIIPEVPEGYEIEEVERTEPTDTGVQVVYRIKKVSSNKGNFIINFTGTNENGETVASENLTIDGWEPPTEPATISFSTAYLDNGVLVFEPTGGTKTLTMGIEGYTKPIDVFVSINDENYNVHLIQSELEYDDGYDYAVWKFGFESEGNDSNGAYEGTITITYRDGLTNFSQVIPFYVRYNSEGKIEAGNNYKFDKDGNVISMYDTIGVGFLNIETINTPTSSPWITVGQGVEQSGPFVGLYTRYNYPIYVEPNDGAERIGYVKFTGVGTDGKLYEDITDVFQEGDNTEIIIDSGMITLKSLSMTLPSEGGSDTFQVDYYAPVQINTPVVAGGWATITEIASEDRYDTAYNGMEDVLVTTKTYKVTAQPTTSGRQAKIKLSGKFWDNTYYEKDKFVVYQLAEGSTELQGSVSVLRSTSEYTYYGTPIGFNPEVGYIGVSPIAPMIDVDWCRVVNITDKTSKDYDVIKVYDVEMDVNESQFKRSCTITFMGRGEDGTYIEVPITVTQQGQEEIINDGVYSNYKGYFRSLNDTLYSVKFITNPKIDIYGDIMLSGDSPVVVSYTESKRLFEPLRTSTCTVRVVSNSYLMNLYTGKAQGTQVILTNEDTGEIQWCGFLQPNLYNQGYTSCVEEIEFEASDCLSSLQYFNYEHHFDNGRKTVSFKDIMDDIMYRCSLINSFAMTQKVYSDTFQSRIMKFGNFYIAEQNFYSEEDEPWTLQEVLTEICKYMGYVCFQWCDKVYFIDYESFSSNGKLVGYEWRKSDLWRTEYSIAISSEPNEITENSYRDTGGDMSLDDVFNMVTVNCNYYNFEDLIPDLFDDELLSNRFEENGYITISRYGGKNNENLLSKTYYKPFDHKNINSIYYLPMSDIQKHETKTVPTDEDFTDKYFFRNFVGGNIVDMIHLNYDEANGKVGESKDWERYLMISQLNRPWCGAMGTFNWENYNLPIMEFKDLPVLFIDNTAKEDTIERIPTKATSTQNSIREYLKKPVPNYLVIQAEAMFVTEIEKEYYEGVEKSMGKKNDYYTYGDYTFDNIRNTPALCFYLEVPQKGWWDGTEWVHYKTHFEVPLEYFGEGKDDNKWYENVWGESKAERNNIQTNLFLGTTGYNIPLPSEMTTTNDMYFAIALPKRFAHLSDILGGDYTGKAGNAYCFIKNLSMKIVNRYSALYEDEDVIYENVIDEGNVIEGEEITLKITSDNYNGFSFSHVSTITAEEKITTNINFYNRNYELVKPEQAIIEKYVNQYSTPSIKENITVDMSFLPTQIITDTYWDKDFVIIGQEIDYQYDRQKITLLEKK